MTGSATSAKGDQTLMVRVPLALRKRGGRKLVVTPEGSPPWAPPRARIDSAMVKALARAHRWNRMLENGEFATIEDLAAAETINPSYLGRVLRLTLLAPDIAETILDGGQPPTVQLDVLFKPFPVEWESQRVLLRLRT